MSGLTAYGLPITVCEKAPTTGPWSILPMPANMPCPWCGRPSADHVNALPDESELTNG